MRWLKRLNGVDHAEGEKAVRDWQQIADRAKKQEDATRQLADKLMNGHKHDILARKK